MSIGKGEVMMCYAVSKIRGNPGKQIEIGEKDEPDGTFSLSLPHPFPSLPLSTKIKII